jgi:hypothetical protein
MNSHGKWILGDGDADFSKPSTNGTWLYLNEATPLTPKMVFKAN